METDVKSLQVQDKARKYKKGVWYLTAFMLLIGIIIWRCPPMDQELNSSWWITTCKVLLEASFVFYLIISGFSFVIAGLLRNEKINLNKKIALLIGFFMYSLLSYIIIHSFESDDFSISFLSIILGSIGWIVVLIDSLLGIEKTIIWAGIKYSTVTFSLGIILPIILSVINNDFAKNDYFITFQGGIIATALIIVNIDFDPFIYVDTFKASFS